MNNKSDKNRLLEHCRWLLDVTCDTGGILHIYLADGNYEKRHIEWLVNHTEVERAHLESDMARRLLLLTDRERWEIYRQLWGEGADDEAWEKAQLEGNPVKI